MAGLDELTTDQLIALLDKTGAGNGLDIAKLQEGGANYREQLREASAQAIAQMGEEGANAREGFKGSVTTRGQDIDHLDNAQQNLINATKNYNDAALERQKLLDAGANAEQDANVAYLDRTERARVANLNAAVSQYNNAMNLLPEMGKLSLAESERVQGILQNGGDYLARAFESRGGTSPLAKVLQSDQINAVRTALNGLRQQVSEGLADAQKNVAAAGAVPTSQQTGFVQRGRPEDIRQPDFGTLPGVAPAPVFTPPDMAKFGPAPVANPVGGGGAAAPKKPYVDAGDPWGGPGSIGAPLPPYVDAGDPWGGPGSIGSTAPVVPGVGGALTDEFNPPFPGPQVPLRAAQPAQSNPQLDRRNQYTNLIKDYQNGDLGFEDFRRYASQFSPQEMATFSQMNDPSQGLGATADQAMIGLSGGPARGGFSMLDPNVSRSLGLLDNAANPAIRQSVGLVEDTVDPIARSVGYAKGTGFVNDRQMVVGDSLDSSPNPEVINNPTGAPLSVSSPRFGPLAKQYAAGTADGGAGEKVPTGDNDFFGFIGEILKMKKKWTDTYKQPKANVPVSRPTPPAQPGPWAGGPAQAPSNVPVNRYATGTPYTNPGLSSSFDKAGFGNYQSGQPLAGHQVQGNWYDTPTGAARFGSVTGSGVLVDSAANYRTPNQQAQMDSWNSGAYANVAPQGMDFATWIRSGQPNVNAGRTPSAADQAAQAEALKQQQMTTQKELVDLARTNAPPTVQAMFGGTPVAPYQALKSTIADQGDTATLPGFTNRQLNSLSKEDLAALGTRTNTEFNAPLSFIQDRANRQYGGQQQVQGASGRYNRGFITAGGLG